MNQPWTTTRPTTFYLTSSTVIKGTYNINGLLWVRGDSTCKYFLWISLWKKKHKVPICIWHVPKVSKVHFGRCYFLIKSTSVRILFLSNNQKIFFFWQKSINELRNACHVLLFNLSFTCWTNNEYIIIERTGTYYIFTPGWGVVHIEHVIRALWSLEQRSCQGVHIPIRPSWTKGKNTLSGISRTNNIGTQLVSVTSCQIKICNGRRSMRARLASQRIDLEEK
jgi:hypothetical protein